MTNGLWEAQDDARADYESEVLAEGSFQHVLNHLDAFVEENLDDLIDMILRNHSRYLEYRMNRNGYYVTKGYKEKSEEEEPQQEEPEREKSDIIDNMEIISP